MRILEIVNPYSVLKKKHIKKAREILEKLTRNPEPTPLQFIKLAEMVDDFSTLNYSKKKTNDANIVRKFLSSKGFLPPVTTDIR
jgi:hypothetical protein